MYPYNNNPSISGSDHIIEAILILPEYAKGGVFQPLTNAEADAINYFRAKAGDVFKEIYNHSALFKYKNKELKITWVEGNLDSPNVNEYLPFLASEILPALIVRNNSNRAVWHGAGRIENSRINIIKLLSDNLNNLIGENEITLMDETSNAISLLPLLLLAGGLVYTQIRSSN